MKFLKSIDTKTKKNKKCWFDPQCFFVVFFMTFLKIKLNYTLEKFDK